jgi:glycosyltransferase involved in cell wall biosynthesis
MNKVSVIMPTFNSEKYISKSIESILAQTYNDIELLITDDVSSDATIDIVSSYSKIDKRVKLFTLKKNSGSAVTRNYSILNASGRYIAFCDSDDQWKVDKLFKQIKFMSENNAPFSYTSYDVINEQDVKIGEVIAKPHLSYSDMLKNNYIGCLTAVYDTHYLGKLYMPLLRKRQDWALWLAILKKVDYALGIDEKLSIYRDRGQSLSSKKFDLIKYNWDIYSKVEGYPVHISIYFMMRFIIYYYIKKTFK